jgi:hypothetical protein
MGSVTVATGVYAQARVVVKDGAGRVIPGATVTGAWSGVVNTVRTAVTTSAGVATSNSPVTTVAGTYKYTVTGISAAGFAYDATLNKMSTNAFTR